MTDSKNSGDTTLTVTPTKTLSLKRPVEAGIVRQSFSHGRSKAVVVEKVKRRALAPGETHPPRETAPPAPAPHPPQTREKPRGEAPQRPTTARPGAGVVLRSLTEEEREAGGREPFSGGAWGEGKKKTSTGAK
jgi:translation initiation factor IF-2